MFMFEMHLISGITDGWQGCEPHCPSAKRNVETGPYLACILVSAILLISVDCCFFAFFGLFSSDFGFLYSRSIPNLLLFFSLFSECWPVGSLQPSFSLAQTLLH